MRMLFLTLIVSALPWFPTPLSLWGLGILFFAALLSRVRSLALIALLLVIQETRIDYSLERLWPEHADQVTCIGRMVVDQILTRGEAFSSLSGRWISSGCENLNPEDSVKTVVMGRDDLRAGDTIEGAFRFKPIVALVNSGGFDARRHALAEGWRAQASIKHPTVISHQTTRLRTHQTLDAWPQPLKGFALALMFGEKDQLNSTLRSVFEGLGLAHLLAISGLHVGIVLALCWWGFGKSPWPKDPRLRAVFRSFVVSFAAFFVAQWTLSSPSVVRAGLMASLFSLLPLLDRRVGLIAVLALTMFCILAVNPMATLSTGLLMSAGAVAMIGLMVWARPGLTVGSLLRMQLGFGMLFAPTLSALLGFVYPWLGFIANLIIVPLLPCVLVLLMALLVFAMEEPIQWLNFGLEHAMASLEFLLRGTLFAETPSDSVLWILICLGLMLCVPAPWPKWPVALLAIGLTCLLSIPSGIKLWVHDIGQGSAATLQMERDSVVMDLAAGQVDQWSRIGEIYPQVVDPSRLSISVSHADLDHIGGLHDLLNRAPIPMRIEGGGTLPGLLHRCSGLQNQQVKIEVLWPTERFLDSENHQSCVLLIESFGHHVLMLGDADWLAEAWVLRALDARNLLGRVETVVVSHHGASDGSNPSLVSLLGAKHALVSVGRHNRYGHPHRSVIDRWQAAGATVYRTDQHGALQLDFKRGEVSFERRRRPRRWNPWPVDQQ